ncbi:MAG: hypothetical protein QXL94_06415 [Candidatus Parvarchaeum sp.]
MIKEEALSIVKKLGFDTKKVIYSKDNIEVYVLRPSKLSKRFQDYDIYKNFQIWLKEDGREFRPNHLRVLIDLNLRIRSRPELKKALLLAFDNIFYGNDPNKELNKIKSEKFGHSLNDIFIIGYLAQLFHLEQEYAYNKASRFNPPNLFLQGWIREFLDNPKEIDNLCMSVAHGQPPAAKYVDKENKKSKNYVKNLEPLWYLKDS